MRNMQVCSRSLAFLLPADIRNFLPRTCSSCFPGRSRSGVFYQKNFGSNARIELKISFSLKEKMGENRTSKTANLTHHDLLSGANLAKAILSSKLVVCRSGYSTIMDLLALQRPAFLIPTPGQERAGISGRKPERTRAFRNPNCGGNRFGRDLGW